MSSESENVATLKNAYQRWHDSKAGSVDHWLSLMSDDIKFRSLAGAREMQFTRPSINKEEVKDYFTGLTNEWEMNYYRVDEYIAQGDRVVALSQCRSSIRKPAKCSKHPRPTSTNFATARSASFSSFTTPQPRLRRPKLERTNTIGSAATQTRKEESK